MNLQSVFDLSPAEKLKLVEDLWDDLAANPENVPLHSWQIEELKIRKEKFQNNPDSGLSWEDVKQRVRNNNER